MQQVKEIFLIQFQLQYLQLQFSYTYKKTFKIEFLCFQLTNRLQKNGCCRLVAELRMFDSQFYKNFILQNFLLCVCKQSCSMIHLLGQRQLQIVVNATISLRMQPLLSHLISSNLLMHTMAAITDMYVNSRSLLLLYMHCTAKVSHIQ